MVHKRGWLVLLLFIILLSVCSYSALAEESGRVSGLVWLDKTPDGELGAGETGVGSVKISLEGREPNGAARTVAGAVTAKSGDFYFEALPAGEYRLCIEGPQDYRFTIHGGGSAALPASGNVSYTPWFYLEEGASLLQNVGMLRTNCAVTLIAFVDENANGGRMQSEPLVKGVQAELLYEYGGEIYTVATALTDRDGQAFFQRLSPAAYQVRVVLPDQYVVGPLGQKINSFYNCILANEDNTGLSAPFTLAPKESLGMGVGMVRTGSLSGKIWYDADFDGKWGRDEGGLTGAEITLYSPQLNLSRTSSPAGDGSYAFRGLQPGDYQLEFALPEGMVFTYPGESMLSEPAGRGSVSVSIQVDVNTSLGPVGAMPAAGLSVAFYQDTNLNGLRDAGEPSLPGVRVTASQGGKKTETVTSDENGEAVFHSLRGGETQLSAVLPEGFLFSADLENLFSADGAQAEAQAVLSLDGTEPRAEYSAAVTAAASISGMLFEDADNTGFYHAGSLPLSGFTVLAVADDGREAARAQTDAAGAYTLSPLLPGSYTVRFLLDDAYVASPYTGDQEGETNHIRTQTPEYGETDALSLAPGQAASRVDGGVFRAGMVDGYVLMDEAYASPENGYGLEGISVILLQDGVPFSDYTYGVTDETGYFFIKGVLPGTYTLSYVLPDSVALTGPQAAQRRILSDPFTTESGSQVHMPELRGLYTSTLSGSILCGEGQADFTAVLTLAGTTVPQVYEISAQPNETYAFTGLLPDLYTLTVTLPEGMVFGALPGSPIAPAAENRASATLSFAMGKSLMNANILASLPVSLSGGLYYDDLSASRDEAESGAEGRELSLWLDGVQLSSVQTDSEGGFRFSRLVPNNYELRVQLDENEEILQPGNGRQEGGEFILPLALTEDVHMDFPILRYASVSGALWSMDGSLSGVQGISVSLFDEDGEMLSSAETDAEGAFSFGRLMPGEYFLAASLPQGYLFARSQDTASRESYIQSLPDGGTHAVSFRLAMGDDLSGVDIGMGAMGRIGDQAWLDENGNGMQDIGEPAMPGVGIQLYQYGELIAETQTDVYGRYLLSDLHPGEYEMRVTMPKELKPTLRQTEFPLVASIMPESDDLTVSVPGVVVPSGSQNLHCDLGFALRKKGVYPPQMDQIPQKDWRPYSDR